MNEREELARIDARRAEIERMRQLDDLSWMAPTPGKVAILALGVAALVGVIGYELAQMPNPPINVHVTIGPTK